MELRAGRQCRAFFLVFILPPPLPQMSFQGLYQKAETLYTMGDFEFALVFYHRGRRLRPDLQKFTLGIEKAQEAIVNCIGGKMCPLCPQELFSGQLRPHQLSRDPRTLQHEALCFWTHALGGPSVPSLFLFPLLCCMPHCYPGSFSSVPKLTPTSPKPPQKGSASTEQSNSSPHSPTAIFILMCKVHSRTFPAA